MELPKNERLNLYCTLKKRLSQFSKSDIENGVMFYCLNEYGLSGKTYINENSIAVANILTQSNLPTDLETIIEFFEALIEEERKNENGIVFTPQYIAEYITHTACAKTLGNARDMLVIDPGCGCGIFLIAAAEYLLKTTDKAIDDIIEENIYGIDIIPGNVKRCKLVMKLLSAKYGGNYGSVQPNIICEDSLKIKWAETFNVDLFDCIIGNPPYVNPHDINKETVKFLKENYSTTQSGVFNIFYAFVEKGMKELHPDGILSFIIPNNFLTIKSALELREYLQTNRFLKRIKKLMYFSRFVCFVLKPTVLLLTKSSSYSCTGIRYTSPKTMLG